MTVVHKKKPTTGTPAVSTYKRRRQNLIDVRNFASFLVILDF
jgi:hypothetical protein